VKNVGAVEMLKLQKILAELVYHVLEKVLDIKNKYLFIN